MGLIYQKDYAGNQKDARKIHRSKAEYSIIDKNKGRLHHIADRQILMNQHEEQGFSSTPQQPLYPIHTYMTANPSAQKYNKYGSGNAGNIGKRQTCKLKTDKAGFDPETD